MGALTDMSLVVIIIGLFALLVIPVSRISGDSQARGFEFGQTVKRLVMSNALEKSSRRALDGFDAYDDGVEGEEEVRSQQGSLIKFTNEATWTVSGEELPSD